MGDIRVPHEVIGSWTADLETQLHHLMSVFQEWVTKYLLLHIYL